MQTACAVLYCHLWLLRLYYDKNFPHYLINGANVKKVVEYKTCVLTSSTISVRNISQSKNN